MRATPVDRDGAPYRIASPCVRDLDRWFARAQTLPVTGERRLVDGIAMCEVTFAVREEDPHVEVMVHVNGLTDSHRDDITPAILPAVDGTAVRTLTYLLPADGVFSYRLVRGRPLDREAGRTRDGWFRVHRAGEADPRCPESIPHAHGSRSSVWTGPDARRTPGWGSPSVLSEITLDDERRVWWQRGAAGRWLVLFDGAIWRELGIAAGLASGLREPPGLILIDAIDQQRRAAELPDVVCAASLVEEAVAAVGADSGDAIDADECVIAGQSYGGLAAASIVIHRPDLARTAICQSGSFWYRGGGDRGDMSAPGELTHRLRTLRGLGDRRLIVQAGTEERSMVAQAEGFADAASAAGMTVSLAPWRGGHDYAWWRHGLVHALRGLEASGG